GSEVNRYYTASPLEYVLFERPKTAGGCWNEEVHFAPHKIVVRQICEEPTASILRKPLAVTGNIFTVCADSLETELYVLGILNSRLTNFFWRVMFTDFKSSFPQVTIFSLAQVPIRVLNLSNIPENQKHDNMVALVETMLSLYQQLAAAKSEAQKTVIQRQIAATDAEIDRLVYDLYGLSAEEIAIVEGTTV
ncbi:MAG: TaqI-like C-terminal specificity domain-containing protein, partial [Candidatus Glassbacteria bacterium]